jgi:hypothetical protein
MFSATACISALVVALLMDGEANDTMITNKPITSKISIRVIPWQRNL